MVLLLLLLRGLQTGSHSGCASVYPHNYVRLPSPVPNPQEHLSFSCFLDDRHSDKGEVEESPCSIDLHHHPHPHG